MWDLIIPLPPDSGPSDQVLQNWEILVSLKRIHEKYVKQHIIQIQVKYSPLYWWYSASQEHFEYVCRKKKRVWSNYAFFLDVESLDVESIGLRYLKKFVLATVCFCSSLIALQSCISAECDSGRLEAKYIKFYTGYVILTTKLIWTNQIIQKPLSKERNV